MIQATTPTVILTLPETVDLTSAQNVYVTFRQKQKTATVNHRYAITVTKELGEAVWLEGGNVINVFLTQEETLKFTKGLPTEVQVNWIDNGIRNATEKAIIGDIKENLLAEVIEL